MLGDIWNSFLYQPLLWLLVELYKLLGNFGLAILALTFLIRGLMVPLSISQQRSAKQMQKLKPKIDDLNKKYGKDKQRMSQEQMKLYKEHGVNPAAGCLPMIVVILVTFAIYRVFINFLQAGVIDGVKVDMSFLWLNLAKPDPYYILPILAGVSQFMLSWLMMDKEQRKKVFKFGKDTSKSVSGEFGEAMQKQMVLFMPLMIVFISLKLPSGLALYWVAANLFYLAQQQYVNKKYRG